MLPKKRALDLANECLTRQGKANLPGAASIKVSQICRLWGGVGHIYRVQTPALDFIVKHVTPPPRNQQSFGDRRKSRSYQVEANFYESLAPSLLQDSHLALPNPYLIQRGPDGSDEVIICMSYLHGSSLDTWNHQHVRGALTWLANFHASQWGSENVNSLVESIGLHEEGSYWYLGTRPDEHSSMSSRGWEGRLKLAANAIDMCLRRDPMQCLVHGDPKDANMMRLVEDGTIAIYDFQYCGKGTPTRDLAYFLCSSCNDDEEDALVEFYYNMLTNLLAQRNLPVADFEHFKDSLEMAFCDFCRFMCGWGQWGYSLNGKVQSLLNKLDSGTSLGSEEKYDEAIRREFW